MRAMLTNSSDYLLSPDIIICPSLEDVYTEVDQRGEDDDTLLIYVDSLFVDASTLHQLELYRFEFKEFGIIIDKEFQLLLDIGNLKRECYLLTKVTNTASELFLNAEKYDEDFLDEQLGDFKRGLESKALMKSMVEYDFVSFKSSLTAILSKVEVLGKQNAELRSSLHSFMDEKKHLLREISKVKLRANRCEKNRTELLSENIKMKYERFLDNIDTKVSTINTPIIYIKAILPKDDFLLTEFCSILNQHIRNKFNKNSTLVVIDDFNTLKLKKVREDFSYISSDGQYNLRPVGNKIITTSLHIESLMDNFEKFSGIKDLFIVLDITCSTRTYVVGEGAYIVILNDKLSETLYLNLPETLKIQENLILDTFVGDDDFNTKLNITRSEIFGQIEKIAMELM